LPAFTLWQALHFLKTFLPAASSAAIADGALRTKAAPKASKRIFRITISFNRIKCLLRSAK
jgi:hypothetical protein